MPDYFNKFPKIDYTFRVDGQDQTVRLTDTMYKFVLRDQVRASRQTFYPYRWKDDDRIDILSDLYYDSPDFYWLVMMSGQHFDMLNAFPYDPYTFSRMMALKYGARAVEDGYDSSERSVLRWMKNTVAEYRDADGDVIDLETYTETPGGTIVYVYDKEIEENEDKRTIQLIDKSIRYDIANELEKSLNKVTPSNIGVESDG